MAKIYDKDAIFIRDCRFFAATKRRSYKEAHSSPDERGTQYTHHTGWDRYQGAVEIGIENMPISDRKRFKEEMADAIKRDSEQKNNSLRSSELSHQVSRIMREFKEERPVLSWIPNSHVDMGGKRITLSARKDRKSPWVESVVSHDKGKLKEDLFRHQLELFCKAVLEKEQTRDNWIILPSL